MPLKTFDDFLRIEDIDSTTTDISRWHHATADVHDYRHKEGFETLFNLARLCARKYPQKLMVFLKSLPDDEIQQQIKDLENSGWSAIKGKGHINTQPTDDGMERIAKFSADDVGDTEE